MHTRLKLVIDKSGGYSRNKATKYIMERYWISDRDIAYYMSKFETIHKSIAEKGIGEIIGIVEHNIRVEKKESEKSRREFYQMMAVMSPYIGRFREHYRF